jgi:hypothetical protein
MVSSSCSRAYRWGETVSEVWPPTGLLFIPQVIDECGVCGVSQWDHIGRGKLNNSENSLSQCHFTHHKSHIDCPRHEPRPPRW